MNITTLIITITATIFLYITFLVLGVGGIDNNRRAQGLDQDQNSDN
tara:strand:- start:221 stop:358 length:138 start_codon:yes stop_codon:yes gene_type:complete